MLICIAQRMNRRDDQITKSGKVIRGIFAPDFGIIFAIDDIMRPVQGVFNRPMLTLEAT